MSDVRESPALAGWIAIRWGWWLVVREHRCLGALAPEHHRHAVNLACFTLLCILPGWRGAVRGETL